MTEPRNSHPMHPPAPSAAQALRDQALDWFVRQRNPDFTAGEQEQLQAWLDAGEDHRQAFAHWQRHWQAAGRIPAELQSLLQRNLAYDKAMEAASAAGAHLAAEPSTPPTPPKPSSVRRRGALSACAAALAAMAVTGAGWMAFGHWQAQPVFEQTFGTARGQLSEVTLPDGSRLQLDTATRLRVTYYRQRREVALLDGQAVFAVQADAQRPFQVSAAATRITVVGTRFSVRSTPGLQGAQGVHVAVEEGRVRVQRMAPDARDAGLPDAVLLSPGQQVSADARGVLAPVTAVSDAGIAPWRRHRVRFDNQRLDQVLAELARYGELPLVIRDPAVAALRITGVFDPRDPATLRRILPAAAPVRLVPLRDGVSEVVLAR